MNKNITKNLNKIQFLQRIVTVVYYILNMTFLLL